MPLRLAPAVLGMVVATIAGCPAAAQNAPAPQSPEYGHRAPGFESNFMRRAWGRMTIDDRKALFDAHLAAMRVGLKLTPEQEKLWPPLEAAMREAADEAVTRQQHVAAEGPPADPIAGLRRRADRATRAGALLRRIADAAEPLYASLTADQKRRLPILLQGLRPIGADRPRRYERAQAPAEAPGGWGPPE